MSTGSILITGISASGKTTLGKRLYLNLRTKGISNVEFLDGEEVRKQLAAEGKVYGYRTEERNQVAIELAKLASKYNTSGSHCIIAAICHVRQIRRDMRAIIEHMMEVYLDCSVDVCAKRDYKSNYKKARQGLYENFVGVTEEYQKSDHVELTLKTGENSIEYCSRILLESALQFLQNETQEVIVANQFKHKIG